MLVNEINAYSWFGKEEVTGSIPGNSSNKNNCMKYKKDTRNYKNMYWKNHTSILKCDFYYLVNDTNTFLSFREPIINSPSRVEIEEISIMLSSKHSFK